MQIDISADIDDAMTMLQRAQGNVPEALGNGLDEAAFIVEGAMKVYPPQRPTTYVRTGRLGRSWTTRKIREPGAVGRQVGNVTEYGPWVQSKDLQAWMHRDWWQTDEEVIADNRATIVQVVNDALLRGIR